MANFQYTLLVSTECFFSFFAEVDTRGKCVFKNLRLRAKLTKKEVPLETPQNVKEKVGLKKRLGNFFNFFKNINWRKNRRVQPLAVGVVKRELKSEVDDAAPKNDYQSDTTSFTSDITNNDPDCGDSESCSSDEEINRQEVDQIKMFHRIDKKIKDGRGIKKLTPIQNTDANEFFQNLEDKVAASKASSKLAPIANAHERNESLKYIIYTEKDFARIDIQTEGGSFQIRPNTPSLNKPRRSLTGEQLQLKMIKANERRVEAQAKRLRPATARRERFQRCKMELETAKDNQINRAQTKADNAVKNKLQQRAEKAKVST